MVQHSTNVYGIVGTLVFFVLAMYYFGAEFRSTQQKLYSYEADHAMLFPVKVIRGDMMDADLIKLDKSLFNFLAVIDAGSSGCRVYVYRYGKLDNPMGPLYVLPQPESKKVKPGLSSFAKNPAEAGASLQGLVDFIKENVPQDEWENTPIWLKATAGLRLLPESESNAIIDSVREFLADKNKTPFIFRPHFARVISGNEEGGLGWISYNYMKRIIGPKRESDTKPYAVVEMGGASSQVSQMAPSEADAALIPQEYRFSFNIEGQSYHLYTHSYLGFGAEQAREGLNRQVMKIAESSATTPPLVEPSTISDPCLNEGFKREADSKRKDVYEGPEGRLSIVGSAEKKECMSTLSSLFESKTSSSSCEDDNDKSAKLLPLTFNCVRQPEFVTNSENFLVFENFYYVSSALGMDKTTTTEETSKEDKESTKEDNKKEDEKEKEEKKDDEKEKETKRKLENGQFPLMTTPLGFKVAAESFCATSWKDAILSYPKDEQPKDTVIKLCFGASFAFEFLTKGLGLKENKAITIQQEVDGSEIEWALGAGYKEIADFLKVKVKGKRNLRVISKSSSIIENKDTLSEPMR